MVFPETTHTLRDGRTLLLRPPVSSDAQACVAFHKAVGGETDFLLCDENGIAGLTVKGEEAYLAASRTDPEVPMWLGFVDDALVCVFDIRPGGRPRTRHVGTVALAVKRAYWGLGIGSIAMQAMVDFGKASETLAKLTLDVREGNDRAIRLYERFGFVRTGVHRGFIRIGDTDYDQILMDLEL